MCVTYGHAPRVDPIDHLSGLQSDSVHVLHTQFTAGPHMLLVHMYWLLHVVEEIKTKEKCTWYVANVDCCHKLKMWERSFKYVFAPPIRKCCSLIKQFLYTKHLKIHFWYVATVALSGSDKSKQGNICLKQQEVSVQSRENYMEFVLLPLIQRERSNIRPGKHEHAAV